MKPTAPICHPERGKTAAGRLSSDGKSLSLPVGWKWITVGDIAASMKNGVYKQRDAYIDNGFACLRMYNIDDGRIVWRDIKRMKLAKDEIRDYLLLPGDILVNRVNSRELVGKAAVIPDGLEACVYESKNIRLRIRRDLAEPRFVNYRFLQAGQAHFNRNAQQVVGMASISQPQIAAFGLPLPPLIEQRRIVAEIEKQFTRLEAGVAALRRVQANLHRYRAAVLKVACERELVSADMRKWRELTLPEFCSRAPNSMRRGPFGSAIKKDFFVPDGYKVYQQQNAIYDDCSLGSYFITNDKFQELSSFGVKPDDLIISCSGTVGRIAVVPTWAKPGIINQALLKLTLDQDIVLNSFFVIMFRHRVREVLIAGARGAAMQNIAGVAELKKFVWPVPPLAEQKRIVAEVERRLSVVEELSALVTANLQRATRLRQSILQRAFEGKLLVNDDAGGVAVEKSRQARHSSDRK